MNKISILTGNILCGLPLSVSKGVKVAVADHAMMRSSEYLLALSGTCTSLLCMVCASTGLATITHACTLHMCLYLAIVLPQYQERLASLASMWTGLQVASSTVSKEVPGTDGSNIPSHTLRGSISVNFILGLQQAS